MTPYKRRSFLGLFLALAARVSYAALPIESKKPLPENIKGWSPDWLIGTSLDLISETNDLQMRFGESGIVSVTAGPKGGPWAAPLFPWRIENKKLFIGDSTQPSDGLEFVSMTGTKLRVRSKGKEVVYEVSR
ncbi:hypothetical protein [Zoogloea sp.]|uniref:hypothetical protein n=1 Tax=Zoogloea sp. TaxID=49181 RepID=UPI001415C63C|nr:MAG: hypothetical protein F9K15_15625 [Zoogloea sp.]